MSVYITHWITNRILSVIALRIADSIYLGDCDQVRKLRKQTLNSSLFAYVKHNVGMKENTKKVLEAFGHPCCASKLPLLKYALQLVTVTYKNRFPEGNWTSA